MRNFHSLLSLSFFAVKRLYFIYVILFYLISGLPCLSSFSWAHDNRQNTLSNEINRDTVTLSFPKLFGSNWKRPELTTWQLAVPLKIKNNLKDPVLIQWGKNKNYLKISRQAITFFDENRQKQFYEPILPNTHDLYIVFESNGIDRYQIQIVQTKQNSSLSITPYISWPQSGTDKNTFITLSGVSNQAINDETLVRVVGNKNIMAPVRKRRDAAGYVVCAHNAFWILDFLLHTHCELTYSGTDLNALLDQKQKGYTQIGGQVPEQQIKRPPYLVPKQSSSVLHKLIMGTQKYPILSSYAAAKACFVPLHRIVSPRKPRGLPNDVENDCVYNTEHIINIYTRIYGTTSSGQWNQGHFERIITAILNTGKTGDPHISASDENDLIAAVELQRAIEDAIRENYIRQLGDDYIDYHNGWLAKLAFSYAQDAYASYTQSATNSATSIQNLRFLTPQEVQHEGGLGSYQIDVDDFDENEIPQRPARVFHQGAWLVDTQHDFETTLVSANHIDLTLQEELQNVLRQWRHDYEQVDADYDSYLGSQDMHMRALAQMSGSTTLAMTHMNVALRSFQAPVTMYPAQQTYFAITRYQGRVVNLFLLSDHEEEDDDEQTNWHIEFALTEPRSTMPISINTPHIYAEGAVRGAGQAALRHILQEAQSMQINSIDTNVVSIPSALMFNRIGFKLIIPTGHN